MADGADNLETGAGGTTTQKLALKEKQQEREREARLRGAALKSDRPATRDLLGHQPLAGALATAIATSPTRELRGATIGVFGAAGTGKSSLLRELARTLAQRPGQRLYVAKVEAGDLTAGPSIDGRLARAAAIALLRGPVRPAAGQDHDAPEDSELDLGGMDRLRYRLFGPPPLADDLARRGSVLRPTLAPVEQWERERAFGWRFARSRTPDALNRLILQALLTVLATAALCFGAMWVPDWRLFLLALGASLGLGVLGMHVLPRLRSVLQQPRRLGEEPDAADRLLTLAELAMDRDDDRLLVIVDDLDRCPPERLGAVLDAVRRVLAIRQTACVFGADHRILLGTDDDPTTARDRLAKFIDLSLCLAVPDAAATGQLLDRRLFPGLAPAPTTGADAAAQAQAAPGPAEPDFHETGTAQILRSKVSRAQRGPTPFGRDAEAERVALGGAPSLAGQGANSFDWSDLGPVPNTPEERECFRSWSTAMGIRNPRTLLRLFNGLNILKSAAILAQQPIPAEAMDAHIAMLFWQEQLLSVPAAERELLLQAFWHGDAPVGVVARLAHLRVDLHTVIAACQPGGGSELAATHYDAMAARVRTVLLPPA